MCLFTPNAKYCCLLLHWGELQKHHLWETASFSTLSTLRGAMLKNAIMAIMADLGGRGGSEPANSLQVVSLLTYLMTETYTLCQLIAVDCSSPTALSEGSWELCVFIRWQWAMVVVMAINTPFVIHQRQGQVCLCQLFKKGNCVFASDILQKSLFIDWHHILYNLSRVLRGCWSDRPSTVHR